MPMNYYPTANYMQDLQAMKDRIDTQMRQAQQNQYIPQQQPMQPITQNFQLSPNPTNNDLESKYAENIDEVKNTFVIKTGIFINIDFSTLWVKDVTGNIRTFKTEEMIELDEKDKEILALQKQIEEMKNMLNTNNQIATIVPEEIEKPKTVKKNK